MVLRTFNTIISRDMPRTNRSGLDLGILSTSLYVSAQIIANILSTKIVSLPLLNLAIDGGTIIYPLTFTLRDFLHKTWGKELARHVVLIAAGINLIMVLLFLAVGALPADPSWPNQEAYELILLPVWRITAASIVAQVISELIDTEVFSRVFHRLGDLPAVLVSNTFALLADSFIFVFIAFLGVLPPDIIVELIVTNILVKVALSLISAPFIKLVPRSVESTMI